MVQTAGSLAAKILAALARPLRCGPDALDPGCIDGVIDARTASPDTRRRKTSEHKSALIAVKNTAAANRI
jgi:hypothetical protein